MKWEDSTKDFNYYKNYQKPEGTRWNMIYFD